MENWAGNLQGFDSGEQRNSLFLVFNVIFDKLNSIVTTKIPQELLKSCEQQQLKLR